MATVSCHTIYTSNLILKLHPAPPETLSLPLAETSFLKFHNHLHIETDYKIAPSSSWNPKSPYVQKPPFSTILDKIHHHLSIPSSLDTKIAPSSSWKPMSPSCRNLPFSTILDKIFITIYLHIKPDYKIAHGSSNPNSHSCRNLPFSTILHKISSPSIYTLNLTVKLHAVPQTLILLLVEIFLSHLSCTKFHHHLSTHDSWQ